MVLRSFFSARTIFEPPLQVGTIISDLLYRLNGVGRLTTALWRMHQLAVDSKLVEWQLMLGVIVACKRPIFRLLYLRPHMRDSRIHVTQDDHL